MKVAVVWNSWEGNVVGRFGRPSPERYARKAVQCVVEGLCAGGHAVALLEGDATLLERLRRSMPPDADSGRPGGIVFNMAYGIQGDCRYVHVPAMLEMAGIPYTGSGPLGHALSLDKVVSKVLMRDAGVPTPDWFVASRPGEDPGGLRFPLIVKPRHESTSCGLHLVRSREELDRAVESVVTEFEQDALVEEYIEGREIYVGLLGNDPPECLPLVELDFNGCGNRAFTRDDKMHRTCYEPRKVCPAAAVSDELAARLREIAVATFRACHCKDYGRVDIRVDRAGNPYVLEINSMASLGSGTSYVLAATRGGCDFQSLVCRILDVAHERYRDVPAREVLGPSNQGALVEPPAVAAGTIVGGRETPPVHVVEEYEHVHV